MTEKLKPYVCMVFVDNYKIVTEYASLNEAIEDRDEWVRRGFSNTGVYERKQLVENKENV